MLLCCGKFQSCEAQLFEKHAQCIHQTEVCSLIRRYNQSCAIEHICCGIGKAGAFHACHGVRPHEGKAVFRRYRLHLLANHSFYTGAIDHNRALLEILCVCLNILYRQLRIQPQQNQIAILGVAVLHKAMHRLHQQCTVANGFGDIPSKHRMLCFFLYRLCHGAANQPKTNYANLHIIHLLFLPLD